MTPIEVIKWSPALRTINRDILCNSIDIVETDIFMDCLSIEFLELLKTKKNDFSSVYAYSDANTYMLGDLCEINGHIYVSLKDTNTSQVTSSDWDLKQAFNEDVYNRLWNMGMAKWIAMSVYSENLAYINNHAGGHVS